MCALFVVAGLAFAVENTTAAPRDYETEEGWICDLSGYGGSGSIHWPYFVLGCGEAYWVNARNCVWQIGMEGSVVYWGDEDYEDEGMAFTSCHEGGYAQATFECNKFGDDCTYDPLE
jgi:hypothetical protein